ncbi:MAG: 4Fe-4S ferredoxin [Sphaerochaetaceae bacterium]|jgi:Fe-S-cluster-containing hydrogenase component 2|nr:4Fe-4S ferredoxin [Sphaerochaetaceae bacterium]MDD3941688.1 4Fe-4S ferredoxin [Sphaerochaetaceae bacterium]MDX9939903.1 4Fe-4S ferredoxin [Sphaerochaetaceae bacterium]
MHAARNVALCTKDCLCLFICPTGATDTETGQIDFAKCLDGCRLCVDACPSHALYLVFDRYPRKPAKEDKVVEALESLLDSKVAQEALAEALARSGSAGAKLAKALAMSNRILAEDCAREARYMLPQSEQSKALLRQLAGQPHTGDFPAEAVGKLLASL